MMDDPGPRLVDLTHQYGGTEFTGLEVLMLGECLLTWVSTVCTLGHASPGSTLDYTGHSGVIWNDIVRDFVAWTSGRKKLAPGCEERLREVVDESGWTRFTASRMYEAMDAASRTAAAP